MKEQIRIGVIGAGVFGNYHASKCSDHPDVIYTGSYDPNFDKAKVVSAKYKGRAYALVSDLLDLSDAVIIAAPATEHGTLTITALKAGCHVLVEKPLATRVDEGRIICELSKSMNRIVQVGHQERFVVRAIGLDKVPEKPLLINAQRLTPFSQRGTDTSVTMDLMTHDIDLVLWLMGHKPDNVSGHVINSRTEKGDQSFAHLVFNNGQAFLEASRVAIHGMRIMQISFPSGTVTIDFNAKTVVHDTPFDLNQDFGNVKEAKDSLAAGLADFVLSIQNRRKPLISAMDGYRAMSIAALIDDRKV